MGIDHKSFTGRVAASARGVPIADQIGAFCYRYKHADLQVLLVTSSNGRWILPKGWPMPGKTGRDVALIEAWEEAGVRKGDASEHPVLTFDNTKRSKRHGVFFTRVAVHTVAVTKTEKDFPESDMRDRRWVTIPQASDLVSDAGLREAIHNLAAHVRADVKVN